MSALSRPAAGRLISNTIPLLFGATIGADILTMSLANFLELKTPHIALLFLATFLASALLQIASRITFPHLSRKELLLGACFGIALFLPRVGYLCEGLLGHSVNLACYDDRGHIQELASVVYSDQFPPRSTFDNSKYLSFYYAPWILGAALYWTGLLLTVKQALGLTILIYQLFFSYFLLYASKVLFTEVKLQRIFVILCVLYGGFDFLYWLSGLSLIPAHSEWWALEFGLTLQFSNFFTLSLWVPHHFIAALAILFALHVLHGSTKMTTHVLAGLFFAFSIFSSVFVVVGSLFVVCWALVAYKQYKPIPAILATILTCCAPLWWIYLGKEGDVGFRAFGALSNFWLGHKRAAFLVFLLVICLELMPLVAAAVYSSSKRTDERWVTVSALLYLLSTFFVAFSGANNYALRGSIIPLLTLTYVATPAVLSLVEAAPRAWLGIAAVSYLSGGLLEYASFSLTAFGALRDSNSPFNRKLLVANSLKGGFVDEHLLEEAARYPEGWYLLEHPKREPKTPLEEWHREIINSDNRYRITLSRILSHTRGGARAEEIVQSSEQQRAQ